MAERFLVVSDLHVTDVENHADGWKRYKSSRYVFDHEFASLLDHFVAQAAPDDELTLVLNGDIFDFDLVGRVPDDAPFKVKPRERRRGLHATPERSAWKLTEMLRFHPGFVSALARFLSAGNEVVYILGNHDREFHFKGVQDVLHATLKARCQEEGWPTDTWRLRFEPWFHVVPGKLYVEHGQQYDYYSSFRHILAPTVRFGKQERIALPMGNISNRLLMNRMGFFNPHATDFILNALRYLAHWFKHYAFSKRSIVIPWFVGSLLVLRDQLRIKRRGIRPPADYEERVAALATRYGLTQHQMARLRKMQRQPITDKLFRMVREFWIDRLILTTLMVWGTVLLALMDVPLWAKLMVPFTTFPLLFFIYESLAKGESVFTVQRRLPRCALAIATMLDLPVVLLGHTHVPRHIPLSEGRLFIDTGTWGPIPQPYPPYNLKPGYRNYVVLVYDGATRPAVEFDCWRDHDGPLDVHCSFDDGKV